jgi:hypothetical protein
LPGSSLCEFARIDAKAQGERGPCWAHHRRLAGETGFRPQPIGSLHLPDPDNHIETRFDADGRGTLMMPRMTLPNAQTRTTMLATGMESGMEAS